MTNPSVTIYLAGVAVPIGKDAKLTGVMCVLAPYACHEQIVALSRRALRLVIDGNPYLEMPLSLMPLCRPALPLIQAVSVHEGMKFSAEPTDGGGAIALATLVLKFDLGTTKVGEHELGMSALHALPIGYGA